MATRMKLWVVHYVFLAALAGCGSSKKEEQARLDANTITLSPEPGEFESGVVVVFKKKDEGTGSGLLEIQKADGTWGIAWSECYGGVDSGATCVNISETKTIKYRLSTLSGESSEKSATYTIKPKQYDASINSTTYTEGLTECAVSTSGGVSKLNVRIKLTNDAILSASKVAYLTFEVKDVSKLNSAMTITNDYATGLSIKGTGDSAPSYASDFYPGRGSSDADNCIVTLTEFTAGQKAKGTFKCDLSLGQYTDATVIGKTFTLSNTAWQCDRWVSYL